jgi:endonuclease YncB( thermonuclease family)
MTYPIRTFDYATIVNVVDGDTCDIDVDLGFSVRVKHRFRLAGINAPEVGQPGAAEATAFLRGYQGVPCVIAVTKLDKYGRYLARITVGGVCINDAMVAQKLAVPYMV